MTKILATLGPASCGKNIKSFLDKTDFVRLNMSHNDFDWHRKIINKIKLEDKNKLILVDVPGVKPRTLNSEILKIKKGEIVKFEYKSKDNNVVNLSNPLPKIINKPKFFSISDGVYEFDLVSKKKNLIVGVSRQNFDLYPKKGLNIPNSIYHDKLQKNVYLKFIKKISKLDIDCVGLSFIQNHRILQDLKKRFPKLLFISKLENSLGYKNRKNIISNSDAVMIDRGDLAAEVGITKFLNYTNDIINDAKQIGKPTIIATENLNSLINGITPTKSDILNIDYYLRKGIDFIMLSDETATSKNWKNTLDWLQKFIFNRIKISKSNNTLSISEIIKNLKNEIIVIFSKKGYFLNKLDTSINKKIILFTENLDLYKQSKLRSKVISNFIKYPKKNLDDFIYKNIKKNIKEIFSYNNFAYLVHVRFPRKNSRANSISIIEKKDFI